MATQNGNNNYAHISSATTTVVKNSPGQLHCVTINKTVAASTVTIYDNTAGSGNVIAVVDSGTLVPTLFMDVAFSAGLTAVSSGAADVTIAFS